MSIIGFNFTKIAAQKLSNKTGKVQVNNNIAIQDIQQSKLGQDDKRSAIRVLFRYDGLYDPKIAHLQFEGDVVIMLDKKEADELIKGWKDKKAPVKTLSSAMNHVLERCNIQGVILAKDMNLPSPIPLPRVDTNKVKQPAKTAKKEPAKAAKKTSK